MLIRVIRLIVIASLAASLPLRLAAAEPELELVVQTGHAGWVNSVALCADGKYLLTGSDDRTAALWDAATGKKLRTFQHSGFVGRVALSGDGRYAATAPYGQTA